MYLVVVVSTYVCREMFYHHMTCTRKQMKLSLVLNKDQPIHRRACNYNPCAVNPSSCSKHRRHHKQLQGYKLSFFFFYLSSPTSAEENSAVRLVKYIWGRDKQITHPLWSKLLYLFIYWSFSCLSFYVDNFLLVNFLSEFASDVLNSLFGIARRITVRNESLRIWISWV